MFGPPCVLTYPTTETVTEGRPHPFAGKKTGATSTAAPVRRSSPATPASYTLCSLSRTVTWTLRRRDQHQASLSATPG